MFPNYASLCDKGEKKLYQLSVVKLSLVSPPAVNLVLLKSPTPPHLQVPVTKWENDANIWIMSLFASSIINNSIILLAFQLSATRWQCIYSNSCSYSSTGRHPKVLWVQEALYIRFHSLELPSTYCSGSLTSSYNFSPQCTPQIPQQNIRITLWRYHQLCGKN